MTPRLYHLPNCPHCRKVRLALSIEGIAHELVEVDPHDRREIVRITGQPRVPVLLSETGEAWAGSATILERLSGRDGSRLLPAGRRDQTFSWILVDRANAVLDPLAACLLSGRDADGHTLDRAAVETAERRLAEEIDALEGLLERGPYLFGLHPTVADIAVHAFLGLLPPRFSATWSTEAPRIAGWSRRMEAAAGSVAPTRSSTPGNEPAG